MKGKCPMCGADGVGHEDTVYFGLYRFDFNCGTHVMYARWSKAKVWARARCYMANPAWRQERKAA